MTPRIAKGLERIGRHCGTALAVGLASMLLVQQAAQAEASPARKAPAVAELAVGGPLDRTVIDAYIREQGRLAREALNEELRREIKEKIVLSMNELRTRS